MTKTVPTTYTTPRLGDFGAGEKIYDAPIRDVARQAHGDFARAGARVPLLLKTLNAFETTSATYTQADEGADDEGLDECAGVLRLIRPILDAGSLKHQLVVAVYGRDFVVRATAYAPDAAASLGSVEVTRASTSWGWSTGIITITEAAADDGAVAGDSPRLIELSLEAKRSTTKAELWQAGAWEVVAVAAQLPAS